LAHPVQADSNKSRRLDMTAAASLETRERLIRVEELLKTGQTDEAVLELLAVAAQYSSRAAPMKAVAVLRQAVRMKPDNPDVRMAYGKVLQQLRMPEDAVREYAAACQLLEAAGRYGEWLEVLRRLLSMDPENLHGRLLLAEALSRANRVQEAADSFRALAELLLQRGEIDDWEKVAERLLFHDSADNTTAHDLALHYVRSGRHAEALGKLILCYESVPNDAELLELIIDALEALGQPDKAAVICRELLRTYQRTGLQDEVGNALKRLYSLDPGDPEARTFMGVLEPEVAANTVIELDAAPTLPRRRPTLSVQTAHPAFDAERTHHTPPAVQTVPTRRPSMRISSVDLPQPASINQIITTAVRQTHVQALDMLSALDGAEDDEEAGFDQAENRTIVPDPREALMALGLAPRPAPPVPVVDEEPVASTRRRSSSLPRPRLARRAGTMTELPIAARNMSKDLSTLDFFIERGFYEPAVALLEALQKRHSDHPELAGYRSRIEHMARG